MFSGGHRLSRRNEDRTGRRRLRPVRRTETRRKIPDSSIRQQPHDRTSRRTDPGQEVGVRGEEQGQGEEGVGRFRSSQQSCKKRKRNRRLNSFFFFQVEKDNVN